MKGNEASYFDRINLAKNRLEFYQKKFTPTDVNRRTQPKIQTDELDQNLDE